MTVFERTRVVLFILVQDGNVAFSQLHILPGAADNARRPMLSAVLGVQDW